MRNNPRESTDDRLVYYCAMRDGRIKIGSSKRSRQRVAGLYCEENCRLQRMGIPGPPKRPVIVAVEPGGEPKEYKRHKQFEKDRISGEFFYCSDELVCLIMSLRKKRCALHSTYV